MSKPAAKAPEPSMEEILASIRRIISDENGAAPQPSPQPAAQPAMSAPVAKVAAPMAAPPAPKPVAPASAPVARKPVPQIEEEPDVLELTDVVESAPQEDFRKFETADVMFRDSEPPMREPAPKYSPPAAMRDDQLLSQHTSAAVSSAFGALTSSMFSGDSRTVDQLVSEMLKPMLKSWLDDNLPSLVERLVRAEIERVSRGR